MTNENVPSIDNANDAQPPASQVERVLSETDLEKIVGGADDVPSVSEVTVTKNTDGASTNLMRS